RRAASRCRSSGRSRSPTPRRPTGSRRRGTCAGSSSSCPEVRTATPRRSPRPTGGAGRVAARHLRVMLPVQVALVSNTRQTHPADLAHVAAALSKQAARDLAPLWAITATVDAFPSLRSVPAGYWPIVVVDHVEGAAGFHLDRNGRPFALVEY